MGGGGGGEGACHYNIVGSSAPHSGTDTLGCIVIVVYPFTWPIIVQAHYIYSYYTATAVNKCAGTCTLSVYMK